MAGTYSKDLRSRVLAAAEAGESVEAAARRFAVGPFDGVSLGAGRTRGGTA